MFYVSGRRMRRRSIVLAVFGVAPVVPALVLLYSADGLGAALRNSEQVTYALALTGAAFAYFHWRMSGTTLDRPTSSRAAGWLTIRLLIVALQGLAQAAFVKGGSKASSTLFKPPIPPRP